jgi:GTP-binding protein HflX
MGTSSNTGYDHERHPDKALIVHPHVKTRDAHTANDDDVLEIEGLAKAIDLDVIHTSVLNLSAVNPSHFIGKGMSENIAALVEELEPAIIIVNTSLSPIQQRNLERDWKTKVIDRTGLILEIFGARAQTKEGKLQVELAALDYQKSRLVKSWTHLERQRGGAGFMGGPGETQLEIDRRIITDRIARLKKELDHVRKGRRLQRRSRERVPYPVVALVGYTNAGKSTLFNKMTGAKVFAEDLLFATLDPTMRKLTLDNGHDVILSDTVGFIKDLPTHLVAAFRATLEEVEFADIILHVRDMASDDNQEQAAEVYRILETLGIHHKEDDRFVEVYNKIDALPEDEQQDIQRRAKYGENDAVALSALTGEGTAALLALIQEHLARTKLTLNYVIPAADGAAMAWLHQNATVTYQKQNGNDTKIVVIMDKADRGRFFDQYKYIPKEGLGRNTEDDEEEFHGTNH